LQAEYYALEGVAGMLDTVERIRESLNPGLEILGILLTMFDGRTKLSQEVEENVRAHFKELAFTTVIPRNVKLAEAPSYSLPIHHYAPASQGAAAYRRLAEEVLLLFAQDPELSAAAESYLTIQSWSVMPLLVFYALRQYLQASSGPT
jgi:chromosome partitioning protein